MRIALIASLTMLLVAPNALAAGLPTLSDADLIALAGKPFDKAAVMNRTIILGRHNGLRVVADHPCSDLCPDYTTRIIHYDVAPGPGCEAAGGVTEMRNVPEGIAVGEEPFCIPKVLAVGR